MAIRPENIIGNLLKGVEELEYKIDSYLVRNYKGEEIYFTIKDSTHQIVIEKILDIYGENGWIVKYNSCQREGSWLSFKAKNGREKK